MGQPTEAWDTPMICTLTAKLDSVSKKEWEQQIAKDKDECITIKHFTDFLTQRCQLLGIIDNKGKRGTTVSNYRENKTLLSHVTTRDVNCSFCKQNHLNQNCEQLQKMPIKDRLIEVKKSKLCINCLRPGHFVKECRSPNCKLCHKKHHSLLHRIDESSELDTREIKVNLAYDAERDNDWGSDGDETKSMTSIASTYENSKSGEHTQIILPTVMVRICDSQGSDIECRALLDSGSQSNFMSIALQKKLCLNAMNVNIPIAGISNQRNSISKKTETVISSLDNKYKIKDTFLILREITNNLPQLSFDLSKLNLPEHIILADKQFNESKPIDLLLGASIFFDVLLTQQIKLGKNKPIVQETMFGWIVTGRVNVPTRRTLTCNFSIAGDNLHAQVERFWTTEEINTERTHTRNELDCEKHFLETFRRDSEGRFELSLPLKGSVTDLGDSLDTAVHRFHLLEKRFERNLNLKDEYVKFMEEYKSLNHMTEIDLTKDDTNVKKYYLPHHGVIKETSTTTKLRVVFDASCRTTSGVSLNDILRVGPITVQAKLLLQRLWQAQISWDEVIPVDLQPLWKQFYETLQHVNEIKIPRKVLTSIVTDIELHAFGDASESAYGACLYVRSTDSDGLHVVRLLCAKSKIAPLKKITLPRLELNAAVLLARLADRSVKALEVQFTRKYFWCDSSIVLNWIAAEPITWNTYVANRVTEIQELSKMVEWRHVPSLQNPADIISRGANPLKLMESEIWWNGPDFLRRDENDWPETQPLINSEVPERRRLNQLVFTTGTCDFIFDNYSSFTTLHKVFTYVLRFLFNTNPRNKLKRAGELNVTELDDSLTILLKLCQGKHFIQELNNLKRNKPIANNSKLLSLNVFLDEMGLIRVSGRIKHSNENFDKRHPVVLPGDHKLTRLIIENEHSRHLHAGQQAVLAAVRHKYWPINGKRIVKDVLKKCVICFKAKPSNLNPLMGNMPRPRLIPSRPFSSVGVDYAGPILIRNSYLRSRKLVKGYICVFVCFATKAVHIELASDMTTATVLNCLKRLLARRGFCSNIYSDNGSNFIGANTEIQNIIKSVINAVDSDELRNFLLKNSITWHFNPPFSPHQGGLWEAAVKSAKTHLSRILGQAHLTYEGLYTVLTQIEAVLNSRPLTPLSNDPEDCSFLTPSHFLIGDTLMNVPERDVSLVPINRLRLYEQLQSMSQHFWKRWSAEYLTTLQQRAKWRRNQPNLLVGDMVVIKDDNLPTLRWNIGRVTALHTGEDGVCRVASVLVRGKIIKRAVCRLCKLPLVIE